MVYRDHEGCVIAALSQKISMTQSVELAEALAARRAVTFDMELSLSRVIIEGDFLRVVQALKSLGRCNTLFGRVIEESRNLGESFQQCKFQHVQRDGNRLAYVLARKAVLFTDINV